MTDYTELKRKAEKATTGPWIAGDDEDSDLYLVGPVAFDSIVTNPVVKLHDVNDADYIAAASPDVVLSMIAEIDNVRRANLDCVDHFETLKADYDTLLAQNQALLEALKRIALTQYHIETPPMESLEEKMRNIARKAINLTRGKTYD